MNKKFTFMVAALLAAGTSSFAAVADPDVKTFAEVEAGKAYFVVMAGNDQTADANDVIMAVDPNAYMKAKNTKVGQTITYEGSFKALEDKLEAQWFVNVTKEENTPKTVEFINVKTGEKLAFDNTGALITTEKGYEGAHVNTVFNITDNEASIMKQELTLADGDNGTTIGADGYHNLIFVEVKNTTVTEAAELRNIYGDNVTLDFEGENINEDKFAGVSFVKFDVSSTSDPRENSGNFYLMKKGNSKDGVITSVEDFDNAEFVVLKTDKRAVESKVPAIGYTYDVIKGKDLVANNAKIESGKYPMSNAQFTAEVNASKESQIKLNQTVAVPNAKGDTWEGSHKVSVGIGGSTGIAETISSVVEGEGPWVTVGKGSVIDVKTWLTGKKLVNIFVTKSTAASEFDYILYSSQEATSKAAVTDSKEATALYLPNVYSQWYISADKNANTVTLKNRETGVEVKNVTFYNTEVAGVYRVAGTNASLIKDRYVRINDVKDANEFDGFLKLTEDELKNTYTFGVKKNVSGFDLDAVLVANTTNITSDSDKDAEALEFQFVPAKNDKAKLDTAFVETKYNYYKEGKLVEAADTLKAIKYNLVPVNAGNNKYVTNAFALASSLSSNNGVFVFRKVTDGYQIANSVKTYAAKTFVDYNKTGSKYEISNSTAGTITTAESFTINANPVAPSYNFNDRHVAFEIDGAYLGVKSTDGAIMTNDTSLLKSTDVDASFSFWAFSADKEESLIPSYYLSSNGKLMYNPADTISILEREIAATSPIETEKLAKLKAELAKYAYSLNSTEEKVEVKALKFQTAKYESADSLTIAGKGVKGDNLKKYKFNVFENEDGTVSIYNGSEAVAIVNNVAVLGAPNVDAAKFNVATAEAPTSNESVSASEVAVVAQNGSVVVKNAAGKNVVVSTILGQVVANEVLTSDNATINVPAGIVVVAVEGESFKVNVK